MRAVRRCRATIRRREQRETIRPANRTAYIYEWSPAVGGPIRRDKLWFYGSARFDENKTYVADSSFRDGRQTFNDPPTVRHSEALRLTSQLTPRNKLGLSLDKNQYVFNHVLLNVGMDAEAGSTLTFPISNLLHLKWTSTVTNRVLIEAGVASMRLGWRYKYLPEVGPYDLTHIELRTNRVSNASQTIQEVKEDRKEYRASLSYVTGSHSFKTGINGMWGYHRQKSPFHGDIGSLNFFDGQPNSINILNTPGEYQDDLNADAGLYVQDRWTVKRFTFNYGGRYDYFNGGIGPQTAPAGNFVPARQFDAVENLPNWSDWAMRVGVAYDLFGTGKTALKGNVSKYVAGMSLGLTSPFNPLSLKSERRAWNDLDGNRTVLDVSGNVQYAEIGPAQDVNFGLASGATRLDPSLPRDYNWQQSITIEHELKTGISIGGGYYRRQFYNLRWTDNLLVDPDLDYAPFTIAAPVDPRLPNGGGEVMTLYNLKPEKLGRVENVVKASSRNRQTYNGFEVTWNARLPKGSTIFGGVTTERLAASLCEVDNPNQRRFCSTAPPFRTLVKVAGTSVLPYGFQLSGAFQAKPGLNNSGRSKGATYVVTSAIAGVPLTGGVPISVQLIEPDTVFPAYQNVLDLRIQRVFRAGRVRIQPHADIFNVFNSNTVVQTNETYGSQYDRPQVILQALYVRLGFQVDF